MYSSVVSVVVVLIDRSIGYSNLRLQFAFCILKLDPQISFLFFPGSNYLVLIMTRVIAPPGFNPKNKTQKKKLPVPSAGSAGSEKVQLVLDPGGVLGSAGAPAAGVAATAGQLL
jgi:hypothetical protein